MIKSPDVRFFYDVYKNGDLIYDKCIQCIIEPSEPERVGEILKIVAGLIGMPDKVRENVYKWCPDVNVRWIPHCLSRLIDKGYNYVAIDDNIWDVCF